MNTQEVEPMDVETEEEVNAVMFYGSICTCGTCEECRMAESYEEWVDER